MSLGPHAAFIWLSYGVVVVAVAGLISWLVIDGRRHTRRLEDLEARGVRRRSSGQSSGQLSGGSSGGASGRVTDTRST